LYLEYFHKFPSQIVIFREAQSAGRDWKERKAAKKVKGVSLFG
jgi:hypothetical protein